MADKIGIVAGSGELPFVVAKNARSEGCSEVIAVAFSGQTNPDFENTVDKIRWIGLGQLGKLISFFAENGVKEAVFIGKIDHKSVFKNIKLDLRMIKTAIKIKDWRTDSILKTIADEITSSGITIVDSTKYLHDLLLPAGVLTKKTLSSQQLEDVKFGFFIAKNLAGLDIGQTVIVKKKTVLALEAIEGTDEAILRGGRLGKEGAVVVKVCKPNQDTRFDVPVIGKRTIDSLIESKCEVLAFEANKTIVVNKAELVSLADKNKIAVVVFDPAGMNMGQFS